MKNISIALPLTNDELKTLKITAINADMTVKDYVRYLIISRSFMDFRMQKMRERIQELSGEPWVDDEPRDDGKKDLGLGS